MSGTDSFDNEFQRKNIFPPIQIENLPGLAFLVFNRDLRLLRIEGQLLQRLGLSADSTTGPGLQEGVSSSMVAELVPQVQAALAGHDLEGEGGLDGLFYRTCTSPIRTAQDDIIGAMVMVQDISAQKLAEQALQESEARYRLFIDNSSDIVIQLNQDFQCVYIPPSVERFLGYGPDELTGKSAPDFVHPDDVTSITRAFQAVLPQHASMPQVEVRIRHKNGNWVWLELEAQPLFMDGSSELLGYVTTLRDKNPLRETVEDLRQEIVRHRLLMENTLNGIILVDSQKGILVVNDAICRMFGHSKAELVAMSISGILDHSDPHVVGFLRGRQYQQPVRQELTGLKQDGTSFPVEVIVADLPPNRGQDQYWIVIRDLTEQKRYQAALVAQEKLSTALEKEVELSELKSKMMVRIAHEFRTPLTVIQATIETLRTFLDRLTPEQRISKSQTIVQYSRHITDMLNEIDLALRGSFVPSELESVPVDLGLLVSQIVHEKEDELRLHGKYSLDVASSAVFTGDRFALRTAIAHVLLNAARFSDPADPVQVRLMANEQGIDLVITDRGWGVLPEEQSRVFEPFFRGSNIGEISGLGLGLTIARACLQVYAGTITFEQAIPRGTIVKIWLPHQSS